VSLIINEILQRCFSRTEKSKANFSAVLISIEYQVSKACNVISFKTMTSVYCRLVATRLTFLAFAALTAWLSGVNSDRAQFPYV